MKKWIRRIHLWLGLVSGLLVFIIAITGALYAFQEEIQNITQPYRRIVVQKDQVLLPSQVQEIAATTLPGKQLHSINYFNDDRSIELVYYHYEPTYYYKAYLNPYSGEVLHVQNMTEGFFNFILEGHMYLWLPREIGSVVVMCTTIIFALMVISGLVLWWPKNLGASGQRFWFRWKNNTSAKRKTWDLHSILGFYSCIVALIFIITGLVWVMPAFAEGWYRWIGGQKSIVYAEPLSSRQKTEPHGLLDSLYLMKENERKTSAAWELHPPETDLSGILVMANPDKTMYWRSDYTFYDQNTLKELPVTHLWGKYKDATGADKVLRLNYDVHVGAALGLPGKTLACLFSLMIASLPVTGFLIWWRRKKKYS